MTTLWFCVRTRRTSLAAPTECINVSGKRMGHESCGWVTV